MYHVAPSDLELLSPGELGPLLFRRQTVDPAHPFPADSDAMRSAAASDTNTPREKHGQRARAKSGE